MSMTAEMIDVTCPRCGERFAQWSRPSLDPANSATCPRCGHRLAEDPALRAEGPWLEEDDDQEAARS